MVPRSGDVLRVTRSASVQFTEPMMFRVIRVHDWQTSDGWAWLDGYQLALQMDDGTTQAITQDSGAFHQGDRVEITPQGRVLKLAANTPAPSPASPVAMRAGSVVSRSDLLATVWGETTPAAMDSLEVILGRLRRKLTGPGEPSPVRTVRGEGLVLELGP